MPEHNTKTQSLLNGILTPIHLFQLFDQNRALHVSSLKVVQSKVRFTNENKWFYQTIVSIQMDLISGVCAALGPGSIELSRVIRLLTLNKVRFMGLLQKINKFVMQKHS